MRYEFPNQEGPLDVAWIEPLRMIERVLAQPGATVADSFFDLDDFMIMTRLIRSPRPSIVLYKHRHTRRYINLDDAGHAYRYYPPPRPDSRGNGQYRRHQDLRTAINNVGLWVALDEGGPGAPPYGWTFDERWTVAGSWTRHPRGRCSDGGRILEAEVQRQHLLRRMLRRRVHRLARRATRLAQRAGPRLVQRTGRDVTSADTEVPHGAPVQARAGRSIG